MAWFGTSMSTPLVAGMATVVRQYFTEGRYPGISTPSAALIKAVLVNGAVDISPGQYGAAPTTREIPPGRPNNVEGWGRANLNQSLFRNAGAGVKIFGTDVKSADAVGTGEFREYQVEVKAGMPLLVNLAWTDYPGSLAAATELVNDLDLEIFGPAGAHYYEGGAGFDRKNNLVGIEIATPQTATYTIRVTGYNVPQGDFVNFGGKQPFAVVASGDFPKLTKQAVWGF